MSLAIDSSTPEPDRSRPFATQITELDQRPLPTSLTLLTSLLRALIFVAATLALSLFFPLFIFLKPGFYLLDHTLPSYPGGEPVTWILGLAIDVCIYAFAFAALTKLGRALRKQSLTRGDDAN